MRSMRRVKNDEAVSPVIATVLLLAITVMLSSMVFVLMQGRSYDHREECAAGYGKRSRALERIPRGSS